MILGYIAIIAFLVNRGQLSRTFAQKGFLFARNLFDYRGNRAFIGGYLSFSRQK